jgi:glycosyltransferase involved in cell wall biosynthesis
MQYQLQERVLMPGFRVETRPWYQLADLFVLSSQFEGFSNVIVEALGEGVPVISTDCPSGPREILSDGKYGRLVPVGDAEALSDAMLTALRTSHNRAALKARAREFAVEKVAEEYLDVMLPEWRGKRAV